MHSRSFILLASEQAIGRTAYQSHAHPSLKLRTNISFPCAEIKMNGRSFIFISAMTCHESVRSDVVATDGRSRRGTPNCTSTSQPATGTDPTPCTMWRDLGRHERKC
jgi:hypothetical protein